MQNRIITVTNTPLTAGQIFTSEIYEVGQYDSLIVSGKTDKDGTLYIDFANDNSNTVWDSTLTYYLKANINEVHKLTVTRRFCRIRIENTSATDQTFIRFQAINGSHTSLTAPINLSMQSDADAIVTRNVEHRTDVALGRRSGVTLWNKFGYNSDIDTGTSEVIAQFGGVFMPLTTASTLRLVSTSANDTSAGTGAQSLILWGVDANYVEQIEVIPLNGLTSVDTTTTWLGINRAAVYVAGSLYANEGNITITAITGGSVQGSIVSMEGTSQQCIFFIPEDSVGLFDWLLINALRIGGGSDPIITVKGWVFSQVSNAKYEIFRIKLDTGVENSLTIAPKDSFVVGEKSAFWLECATTINDTEVQARFSTTIYKNT